MLSGFLDIADVYLHENSNKTGCDSRGVRKLNIVIHLIPPNTEEFQRQLLTAFLGRREHWRLTVPLYYLPNYLTIYK